MPSIPDRLGTQNIVRVLSNASSPPTKLINLSDVNSVNKSDDGLILVWDQPSQFFIMTSVIDSASSTIGGIAYYTNITNNTLGDVNTGSVQIDGGVGIAQNLTVGGGLSVTSASYFGFDVTIDGNLDLSGDVNLNGNVSSSGILTVTDDTDNILGNPDTGALQVDGGVGINKNVTVGGGLYVNGSSEFVGVVTFRGGTIGIGDSTSDDIDVGGEFVSNLVPNTDNTYDIGITDQRWRNGYFAGFVTSTNLYTSGTSLFGGDLSVVGFVSVTEGLYYDSDSYEPNGLAYFNPNGQLSVASTTGIITTSNYILTTYEVAGVGTPVWTTTIDGGEY